MTHRRDMSKEGVQLLVGVKDAVLHQVIGRPNGAYALAPRLFVDRFGAAIRWYRYVVRPVRRHCHLRYQSLQYRIPLRVRERQPVTAMCQLVISVLHRAAASSVTACSRLRWSPKISRSRAGSAASCLSSSRSTSTTTWQITRPGRQASTTSRRRPASWAAHGRTGPCRLRKTPPTSPGTSGDFANRTGFAYTVLDAASADVIGCVYFYPPRRSGYDVDVRSWVREDHAELDKPLNDLVRRWLAEAWPFQKPDYAER